MTRRRKYLLLLPIVCICCTPVFTQDKAARDRLLAARALYYTPTASGLKSFQCEAKIDWKAMLTRLSGKEIPEDNPILKYLQTVHLSIADQLKGNTETSVGNVSMEWTETSVPPEGKEGTVKQMRDGLQMMMSGFFQSWNAYMNGSWVRFADNSVTVTTAESGIHVHASSANTKVDEDFDKNMLLTQVVVESPEMKVVSIPTYVRTDDGLVVSAVASQVNQPPSAPPMRVTFRVEYAKVDSFQLPSNVVYDIRNVGVIEIGLNACQVLVDDSTQKPTARKSGNPTN